MTDCQRDQKAQFAERLQELSELTWGEINQAPRDGLGTEKIAQYSLREAIPEHISPDVRILSFKFGRGARMIGYREERVFHVVWVDLEHDVFNG